MKAHTVHARASDAQMEYAYVKRRSGRLDGGESGCRLNHSERSRSCRRPNQCGCDAAKGAAADRRANFSPLPLPDPPAANGKSSGRLIKSFHRRGVPGNLVASVDRSARLTTGHIQYVEGRCAAALVRDRHVGAANVAHRRLLKRGAVADLLSTGD
jgi:hypothetical protein